ncbi:hypothetical protein HDU81_009976 [Chytriomyces hyalinus]|nr:hypothetical protein HDU81_009976 [Chytriomyces hyalinus]
MATNDKASVESFRIKSEVSINIVRQMIDDWLPKEPAPATEQKSIRSTEGKPANNSNQPRLYNTFPGEASQKKKKLEAKIVAKKAEAQVARAAAIQAEEEAEDSRTKSVKIASSKNDGKGGGVAGNTTAAHTDSIAADTSRDTGAGSKRKLGGTSALDRYLSKKKKK